MKIEMLTTSAGPKGGRQAGKQYDIPDDEANMLINIKIVP